MRKALAAAAVGGVLLTAACSDQRERREEVPPIPSGLDLADVVLTPAAALSAVELQQAAEVVRARAEALGMRVENVEARDGTVEVRLSVRGLGTAAEDRVRQLARRATISVRPVLAMAGLPSGAVYQGVVPPELLAGFTAMDCSRIGELLPDRPTEPEVACDADGNWKYLLGPAALDGDEVERSWASYTDHSGLAGWQVILDLTDEGHKAFQVMLDPSHQVLASTAMIAFVVRGTVVSAPNVVGRFDPSGPVAISANITERTADELAGVIDAGPLPATFTVTSYRYAN